MRWQKFKLWCAMFIRAQHIGGNRLYELEMDKKICRMKAEIFKNNG